MELFELGRFLHSAVGTIALGSFWTAALATKGGRTHRTAGKVYLLALIGVMTLSALMVAGKALEGDPGTAIVLVFLISMVGTASGDVEFHRDARLADWSADDTGRRVWSRPGQTAIWFQLANSSRCAERAPAAPGTRNPRARAVRAPLDVPR